MVLIADYSPLIQYQPRWTDSSNLTARADPNVNKYSGASFHSTQTNGSTASRLELAPLHQDPVDTLYVQATFNFHGTAVYIYGAKRFNHGYFSVSVDGVTSEPLDGYAPAEQGLYQEVLFSKEQLSDTMHTVVLTNLIRDKSRPFVDIDCIVWSRSVDQNAKREEIDDASPMFNFSRSSDVWDEISGLNGYKGNAGRRTQINGAQATLDFQGSDILLYGGTGPTHGQFKVQVDDQPQAILNSYAGNPHLPTVLYAHSNLGDGNHKLVVTNLEDKVLSIDRAEVISSEPANHDHLSQGAMVGLVIGIVAGLSLISVLAWLFFSKRRRAKRRFSTDLVGGSDDSQAAAMGTYLDGQNPTIIEPFTDYSRRTNSPDMTNPHDVNRGRLGKAVIHGSYMNAVSGSGSGSGSALYGVGTHIHVERDAGALPPGYNDVRISAALSGYYQY
ncbi:hypothetical protein RSOLAG1IB_10499 [Rhizoctonia solani AG-1 IB]|uniref:Uncharacterized protein n=1 Tax=Thanatephorus cucumeris (strain AG1-IB / isolate 7/3/14) TaxID=1108050 RepID=A0A0B7FYN3_THACB|nr:hypothetical protein RSOLAG1IB_10499 [Rhizoctonia solani AG-1 IB]